MAKISQRKPGGSPWYVDCEHRSARTKNSPCAGTNLASHSTHSGSQMNDGMWLLWLLPLAVVAYWVMQSRSRSSSQVTEGRAAAQIFVESVRATWVDTRGTLDLSTPEKLADRMELIATEFTAVVASKQGNGKLPPAGLVWMVVIEAVKAANTEQPSILADALFLIEKRYGPRG